MDEKLFSFMWVAIGVVIAFSLVQQAFFAPPPKKQLVREDKQPAAAEVPLAAKDEPEAAKVEAEIDVPPREEAPEAQATEKYLTLGSLDPATGHTHLITFNSRGAAIERIELNSPRYRELNDRSGYLGSLALVDAVEGGCEVRAVGAGTPAALAHAESLKEVGLRGSQIRTLPDGSADHVPGDRIVAVGDTPISDQKSLQDRLKKTSPGQEVSIDIVRSLPDGKQQHLKFTTKLAHRPLQLVRPELEANPGAMNEEGSFLITLYQLGNRKVPVGSNELAGLPSPRTQVWQSDYLRDDKGEANGVEFRCLLTERALKRFGVRGPIEMIKRFRLEPRELGGEKTSKNALVDVLTLEVEFVNQGSDSLRLAYQLDGPSGLTDEGWWYSYKVHPRSFGAAGARDIVFRPEGHRHDMILCGAITKYAIENPQSAFKPLVSTDQVPLNLRYIGCDGQYFCTAILPDPGDDAGDPFFQKGGYRFQNALARVVGEPDRKLKKRSNVSFRLVSSLEEIGPGDAVRHRYTVFAGPKHPDALSPYGLDECIVYGWFKIFAKPMVELLHLLHWLSGGFSYGLAILLLTVIVRGAMFPFGRKMALNAQKMQELAPEMKKIADKYKDDMTKRSQAQQELFRKHNYNPLSGCLVMFLQLPVFVGLYRALSVDIQLRQAPLLPGLRWCSNLAGPDMLWHWADILPGALSDPAGWLGPYLNILPVLSTVLMFIQQKLFSPPPTDDQQKMQQQIMKFMMIFMGVLFHKFAAGLCIYFIASSLWGLAERKMLPKSKPVGSLTSVGPPADSSSNGSKAKGGRLRKKGRH